MLRPQQGRAYESTSYLELQQCCRVLRAPCFCPQPNRLFNRTSSSFAGSRLLTRALGTMHDQSSLITALTAAIPKDLLDCSGKVFYSGRNAFRAGAAIYILGANPGGAPESNMNETVRSHSAWVTECAPDSWSAYRDESWEGKPPGTHRMQPRILHMLSSLGLDAGDVPASNVAFVRSRRLATLGSDFQDLAEACWPFHAHLLEQIRPRLVLCLGGDAGDFVRAKLHATRLADSFVEANNRRWQSSIYEAAHGPKVAVVTHPSIANWRSPATDPTPLVQRHVHRA